MTPRGKGLKPTTPEKVTRRYLSVRAARRLNLPHLGDSAVASALAQPLPDEIDLWQAVPRLQTIGGRTGALDQGPTGSCTGHSYSAGIYTACAAQNQPLAGLPSPDFAYKTARAAERAYATDANDPLPELIDAGAELADVEKGGESYGLAIPMRPSANDGRYSDVDPETVNREIDPLTAERAGLVVVTGPYRLDVSDSNLSDIAAACLVAKQPLWCGFYADRAFENLTRGRVATSAVVRNLPGEGGHAVFLSAYRTNTHSRREFCLENSWGPTWCEGGYCWVDELWLAACWDIWPLSIVGMINRAVAKPGPGQGAKS
jgi:Papain family cysteine protease